MISITVKSTPRPDELTKKNILFYYMFLWLGLARKRLMKLLGFPRQSRLDDIQFIDKTTKMNMLYLWHSHSKLLVEKMDRLVKFDESQVVIVRNIGKGTFGEVFEGVLRFNETFELPVAVKVYVFSGIP